MGPRGAPATNREQTDEKEAGSSIEASIVLPAYNEAANVHLAITEATATAERLLADYEIIVVDDGSADGTADAVRERSEADPRVRLISHGCNRGYGEALRTGFLSARMDYVFFTDADLQFDMGELERFLPFAGTVDVVAGYRLNRNDHLVRRLNAYGWNLLVRLLFYVPVRDIDCAFKLFKRRVLEEVDLQSMGAMVNTELMVKLGRKGASVVEIGVTHRPRTAGEARGASPRVIAKAFWEVARMRKHLASLDGREL